MSINIDSTILQSVNLFDVYEGDKLPEGKKSYALSFVIGGNKFLKRLSFIL